MVWKQVPVYSLIYSAAKLEHLTDIRLFVAIVCSVSPSTCMHLAENHCPKWLITPLVFFFTVLLHSYISLNVLSLVT